MGYFHRPRSVGNSPTIPSLWRLGILTTTNWRHLWRVGCLFTKEAVISWMFMIRRALPNLILRLVVAPKRKKKGPNFILVPRLARFLYSHSTAIAIVCCRLLRLRHSRHAADNGANWPRSEHTDGRGTRSSNGSSILADFSRNNSIDVSP